MRELLRVVVTGVVLLVGLSTGALAQTDASVSGTVTDIISRETVVILDDIVTSGHSIAAARQLL